MRPPDSGRPVLNPQNADFRDPTFPLAYNFLHIFQAHRGLQGLAAWIILPPTGKEDSGGIVNDLAQDTGQDQGARHLPVGFFADWGILPHILRDAFGDGAASTDPAGRIEGLLGTKHFYNSDHIDPEDVVPTGLSRNRAVAEDIWRFANGASLVTGQGELMREAKRIIASVENAPEPDGLMAPDDLAGCVRRLYADSENGFNTVHFIRECLDEMASYVAPDGNLQPGLLSIELWALLYWAAHDPNRAVELQGQLSDLRQEVWDEVGCGNFDELAEAVEDLYASRETLAGPALETDTATAFQATVILFTHAGLMADADPLAAVSRLLPGDAESAPETTLEEMLTPGM